ncbi:MAG TPA: CoA transferase, partial [Rhodospirillales bacterium]|nr:CoA transferase [Rhodospirillales bacterium]
MTITTEERDPKLNGPLAGVRVIEMGQLLAGPFTTSRLADFGAEVI